MIKLKGKYAEAKVFTDVIDDQSILQIENLLNQKFSKGSQPRFMPDVHAGKGCVIGTTMRMDKEICPNLIGRDIGCGVLTVELGKIDIDFHELDKFIRSEIPHGMNVHKKAIKNVDLEELNMADEIKDKEYIQRSIGTLGSGNHMIEIGEDNRGIKYLIIHSGSRNLGAQIAEHYQSYAEKKSESKFKNEKNSDLATLKENDEMFYHYLEDLSFAINYAKINRETIAELILNQFMKIDFHKLFSYESIHNYIDEDKIIRKGAISAKHGQLLTIPINMRDGFLICKGKGNDDWNESAPHGAGRLLSRNQAKKSIELNDFKNSMKHVFTTSVGRGTLDESPFAYKDIDDIVSNVKDTVEILKHVKPVYNFKDS